MSDYLYDKRGAADADVEQLEKLLQPLAYRGAPPKLPRRRPRAVWIGVGSVALAAAVVLLFVRAWPRPGWHGTVVGGVARVDGRVVAGEMRLPLGAWVETGDGRARMQVGRIGTVELSPYGRARLVAAEAKHEQLELAQGHLSAHIDAPPRTFVVETPHARVIDLGCAFELDVDEAGRAKLVVGAGSVALAGADGREVVVPAGSECDVGVDGPGTPHASAPAAPHASAPAAPPGPDGAIAPPTKPVPPGPAAATNPAPVKATKPASHPHPATASQHAAPAAHAPAPTATPRPIAHPTAAQPPRSDSRSKLTHDALQDMERNAP